MQSCTVSPWPGGECLIGSHRRGHGMRTPRAVRPDCLHGGKYNIAGRDVETRSVFSHRLVGYIAMERSEGSSKIECLHKGVVGLTEVCACHAPKDAIRYNTRVRGTTKQHIPVRVFAT